nr:MAG TPA: hypothetical protein [Caudoviricetes sp.]DAZ59675.1 MAG TPA: hypothetical protein [Caudoviricetes sp.]
MIKNTMYWREYTNLIYVSISYPFCIQNLPL